MHSEYEDIVDEFDNLPDIDPTKLKFSIEPKFLDREVSIKLSVPDDKTFNDVMTVLDAVKKAFDEEVQLILDAQKENH